jgi:hypothetical protein
MPPPALQQRQQQPATAEQTMQYMHMWTPVHKTGVLTLCLHAQHDQDPVTEAVTPEKSSAMCVLVQCTVDEEKV